MVLPIMMLCALRAYAQTVTNPDFDVITNGDIVVYEFKDGEKRIKRLRKMADSIKREAHKIEQEASKYAAKLSDSLSLWSKHFSDSLTNWSRYFSDSLLKNFKLYPRDFPPPEIKSWNIPSYPYPRYFSDPNFRGLPLPDIEPRNDERNKQPAPRVIPKRDGIEIPNFPGWRFEKLKNYTMVL